MKAFQFVLRVRRLSRKRKAELYYGTSFQRKKGTVIDEPRDSWGTLLHFGVPEGANQYKNNHELIAAILFLFLWDGSLFLWLFT